jgi:hypothetical protein
VIWQVAGAGWHDLWISNHPLSIASEYGVWQFCSRLYVTLPIWFSPQDLSSVTKE